MQRRRQHVAGAVFSFLLTALGTAAHAQTCDESVARTRLGQLGEALQRPESMAAMDAAKADFAADQDFDNESDARILAAAAVYFKVERHLEAGAVEDACLFLEQADGLINEVVAGK
jgi:hypothetical protein